MLLNNSLSSAIANKTRGPVNIEPLRPPKVEIITTVASSARNQLDAVVTQVVRGTAAATVEMQAGPYRLVALTTAESVDELDLAVEAASSAGAIDLIQPCSPRR